MKNIFTVFTFLLFGQLYKGNPFPITPKKETLPQLMRIQKEIWEGTPIFPATTLRAPGVASPLPFFTDFSTNEFTFVNGSQTNKWEWGNATGNAGQSMYISNDNGTTNEYTINSTSISHAYKDLIIPAGSTSASFSFDWKNVGEGTSSAYDYLNVYLAPATFTPTAGTGISATNTNNIKKIAEELRNQSTWTTLTLPAVDVSSYAGTTMRLIFQWRNDSSMGDNPPAAIDNVRFEIPTCIAPTNLTTSNLTTSSATLNWNAVSPTPAQGYEYYISTSSVPPTDTTIGTATTTNTVNITGLTTAVTYYWWVRSRCVGTDGSFWIAGTPFVLGQIGTGTASAGMLPISPNYGYSYTQTIYTAAEIQGAMGSNRIINKLYYYAKSAPADQSVVKSWKVFIGNTTKTVFATSVDWVPLSEMNQVFDGNIPDVQAGTWLEINLQTPFIWDGTSNVVIAADENSDGYSFFDWGVYPVGTNRGIVYRNDTTNPDPASPPTATSRVTSIPRLLLGSDALNVCSLNAPTSTSTGNIGSSSAILNWPAVDGAGYVLQWRKVTSPASAWTTVTPNPITNTHTLTGLDEQTNYEFRVANICGTDTGAFSAPRTFTTKPLEYCTSTANTNPPTDYIGNVTISPAGFPQLPQVSSTTAATVYSDYYLDASKKITLVKGSTGNRISVQKAFTGNASNVAVAAWIDFDRNGIFENTELVFTSSASTTATVNGVFNVPATVTNSQYPTRMRVIAQRSNLPNACGTFANGETEDYAVSFIDAIPCNNGAPQNASVTNITQSDATINWTADPGGANYVIRYKVAGTNTWINQLPGASLQTSLNINNLLPSTNYEVHISAICEGVEGTPTILTFSTPCFASSPSGFAISQVTHNTAVATWNAIPTATYVFEYRAMGTTNWTSINLTGNSYTMTNLLPYVTYEARVATICGGTTGNFSTPEIFRTEPTCDMPPVELTITKLTMSQAKIQWRAIPNATYVLQWRKVGSNAGWNTINVNTNSYILTGLTEQTKYEVKVANVCSGTQSAFTDVYEITTPSLVYCDMTPVNTTTDYISNVTVNATGYPEMTNPSNDSGYTSYINQPLTYIKVDRGSQNNKITIQKAWRGAPKAGAITVWIDFNRDSQFTNDERIVISPTNEQEVVEATFDVPMNSFVSTYDDLYTVMRVAFSRGGSPAMCENAEYGEVEDYRVIISAVNQFIKLNPEEINIYPVPVTTTINITKVNDGSKYTIYNNAGQVVQTGQIFNNKVDVSQISSGVYMIDIEPTNMGRATKKFIKN